jgi:F-type H+-transporting ATPase subunit alpha
MSEVPERDRIPPPRPDEEGEEGVARPDVGSLLRDLRREVQQRGGEIRVADVDRTLVERISDGVRSLPEISRPRPSVGQLLGSLQGEAQGLEPRVRFHEVGTVQNVGDGVATLSGLPRSRINELVTFPTGVQGMILNLDHSHIDVILLGPDEGIQGGDLVTATGQRLQVPVGGSLTGRVVNALGEPLDGRGPLRATEFRYLERDAPGIVERAPVQEPLQTGLKVVDALIPIGRGQRELVLGDRQTGKTAIAVDAILNQARSDVLCVYVSVGQKKSSTLEVIETLREAGAMEYTTVVMASPSDTPALRYLAPYAGCTMAEFFMYQGRDVFIVYDDLSKHADSYRELSLLLRRPPGREAYPGDIFYLHARLLERAAKLNEEHGGGSLTALPIVETQQGNLSAYIPTNLISITDGQIVLESDLFHQGIKPAVNPGRSVSRVGGKAQTEVMRKLAGPLRLELSQYEEVSRFARIGTEVEESTQRQIRRGRRVRRILTQPAHQPMPLAQQVIVLFAATEGYIDEVPVDEIRAFERGLLKQLRSERPSMLAQLNRSGEMSDEMRAAFRTSIESYLEAWTRGRPGDLRE